MNILRQCLASVLVFLLASPAFGQPPAIGQAMETQFATVQDLSLTPGATLFNEDTVAVSDKGIARIALTGGSQIEILDRSSATLEQAQNAVQLLVDTGSASFLSEPGSPVQAVLGDATVRSANALPAVGTITIESPTSALVVSRKGSLEITSLRDSNDVTVPEGSAARLTFAPDPQGSVPVPAGRAARAFSGKKLALIAVLLGAAVLTTGLILATHQHHSTPANEVSPFKVN